MASYVDITNTLNFSVAFKPTSAFPLDARSMFGSYQSAVAAAATAAEPGSADSIYYIGQTLTVYENDVVAQYMIQPNKTLKAVGAVVVGDQKTIDLDEDGVLSLKHFGVEYYKYVAADVIIDGTWTFNTNMPADAAEGAFAKAGDLWYQYTDGAWAQATAEPVTEAKYELTQGWVEGLEPRVHKMTDSSYELAWYEPSSTTVEGLQSAISTLQTAQKTDGIRMDALEARIETNEQSLATLNGDAETEGSVKNQIAVAVAGIMENPDETINSIKELVTLIEGNGADAVKMANDIETNKEAIAAINTLLGTDLPETTSAGTVIGYIKEVADGLGTAAAKNVEDFATAAQGTKADTAVQSVVAGTANGKLSVDGEEFDVYVAPVAKVDTLGDVKPDGSSLVTSDDGTMSVAAVDYTKVTGLETQITAAKEAVASEVKEHVAETYVAKADVVDSTNVAENVEAASTGKVISEKLWMEAMTWKTEM